MTEAKKRGGARKGSGRPRLCRVSVHVRIRDDQVEKFHKLGGSAWVRKKLDKE